MLTIVCDTPGGTAAIERGFGFGAHGDSRVLMSITFSDADLHKCETPPLGSRNAGPGLVPARFAGPLDPAAGVAKAQIE